MLSSPRKWESGLSAQPLPVARPSPSRHLQNGSHPLHTMSRAAAGHDYPGAPPVTYDRARLHGVLSPPGRDRWKT
jgi:hypothetical protein